MFYEKSWTRTTWRESASLQGKFGHTFWSSPRRNNCLPICRLYMAVPLTFAHCLPCLNESRHVFEPVVCFDRNTHTHTHTRARARARTYARTHARTGWDQWLSRYVTGCLRDISTWNLSHLQCMKFGQRRMSRFLSIELRQVAYDASKSIEINTVKLQGGKYAPFLSNLTIHERYPLSAASSNLS